MNDKDFEKLNNLSKRLRDAIETQDDPEVAGVMGEAAATIDLLALLLYNASKSVL